MQEFKKELFLIQQVSEAGFRKKIADSFYRFITAGIKQLFYT